MYASGNIASGTIMLIDDHPLFLNALSALLTAYLPNYSIDTYHTAEEALSCAKFNPCVKCVILDFSLPFLAGHSAISAFANKFDDVPIIVLSGVEDRTVAQTALSFGAYAFFSKTVLPEFFCRTVSDILSGKPFKPSVFLSDPNERNTPLSNLVTPRQSQILERLGRGLSNKQVASELNIAEITVKKHVTALFHVFNVQNRNHLIIKAKNTGLLS